MTVAGTWSGVGSYPTLKSRAGDVADLRAFDTDLDLYDLGGGNADARTVLQPFDVPVIGGTDPLQGPQCGLVGPVICRVTIYLKKIEPVSPQTNASAPSTSVLELRAGQCGAPDPRFQFTITPPSFQERGSLVHCYIPLVPCLEIWAGAPPVDGKPQNSDRVQLRMILDRVAQPVTSTGRLMIADPLQPWVTVSKVI